MATTKPSAVGGGDEGAASEGSGGGGGGGRVGWAEMTTELLLSIFVRIPRDELARSVPFVCRAWREVAAYPDCWKDIDIERWCRRVDRPNAIGAAVRRLVRRSQGSVQRLSVCRIVDSCVPSIAHFGRNLKVLRIPMSDVSDRILEMHGHSFPFLNVLDISYCTKISYKGIETFGKHCKSLVQLRRNLSPASSTEYEAIQMNGVVLKVVENEAMAIANTMMNLEHLELAYGRFSEYGLEAIMNNCTALHTLDVRGCRNVNVAGNIQDRCESLKSYLGPWVDLDDYEFPVNIDTDTDEADIDETDVDEEA